MSRVGHLDTAWEVAVLSSCIAIFVLVISVVIYQIRRRNKLLKMKENDLRRQTRGPAGGSRERTEKVHQRVHDPERGIVVEAHVGGPESESGQGERDEDYTDDEDEEKTDYNKPKTSSHSKPTHAKKQTTSQTSSDFSHPSRKPPKYYWSYR